MFPNNEDVDKVADQLNSAGFPKEDYNVSRYSTSVIDDNNSKNYNYKEDENVRILELAFRR